MRQVVVLALMGLLLALGTALTTQTNTFDFGQPKLFLQNRYSLGMLTAGDVLTFKFSFKAETGLFNKIILLFSSSNNNQTLEAPLVDNFGQFERTTVESGEHILIITGLGGSFVSATFPIFTM